MTGSSYLATGDYMVWMVDLVVCSRCSRSWSQFFSHTAGISSSSSCSSSGSALRTAPASDSVPVTWQKSSGSALDPPFWGFFLELTDSGFV